MQNKPKKSWATIDWKNPIPTVDIAVFTVMNEQLQVLLIKREREDAPEKGKWALPGGFINVEKDNNLDEAASRVLSEKTGAAAFLEQVISVGNRDRDPRDWFITVLYFALVKPDEISPIPGRDTSDSQWTPYEEAINKDLAFDHKTLLEAAYKRLQDKVEYTALPLRLMPSEFTLGELQKVFELIMDKPLEKKSFRRRIETAEILEDTGDMQHAGARPAKLYRLKADFDGFIFPRVLEGKGSR